jgi:hypothetical protein
MVKARAVSADEGRYVTLMHLCNAVTKPTAARGPYSRWSST